ncbi:MAG: TRAP transporter fused permease subunit [Rhodobacteraceae bacterium]|nr:TRAP transporter fused permease subunit [Paracoccaceae bacterium]
MSKPLSAAEELVASVETGARVPEGLTARLFLCLAFSWSAFQLYVASSVPFWLSQTLGANLVFNNQEVRQIHLAFALVLAMMAFPLFKAKDGRSNKVPVFDWALAVLGAASCLYLLFFKNEISDRAGLPTTSDLMISVIGMITLGLAVYRSLGLPLVIVASVFVAYVFFGDNPVLPDAIQWKGASFGKAMWHYWMQTEGVFGVALGVAASMIFLFVLFGAFLEKAGAGNYFVQLAFAGLGHLRGGPAKAAVVASAASGLYSGSSIANVVTTGTFTIPLMKRTGFSAERAGAVEVASSTNGQLTPPVMGAAAFLISEFTGVSYPELIKHAILPAAISYIALVYIVHLEALKLGLKGVERMPARHTALVRFTGLLFGFLAMSVLAMAIYYLLGWARGLLPISGALVVFVAYLVFIWIAARAPDLSPELDPQKPLPRPGTVAITGLHYLLPIVVLVWNIMIERLSPSLSAFWATMVMIVIVLTQHAFKSALRGEAAWQAGLRQGAAEFFDGMITGARNMIGIAVATGAAGVIVGTVSLTGAHQVIGEFVEFLSGGNLMAMLLLVAVMSLVLGMGLPTTANYIVVSSLMAPVIVSVGAQSGLVVPLVAVHLFVFYFGILADDTPPVGLAAFAAAAISQGDPIKTGIQGFAYDIRTALLPFLFIFNTELLLIDVGPWRAIFVALVATLAMLLFAAATQRYFLARSRWWESLALLLVALTLFRPGFWLDRTFPPYKYSSGAEMVVEIGSLKMPEQVRAVVTGPDFDNPDRLLSTTVVLDLTTEGGALDRLKAAGLELDDPENGALVEPFVGTPFFEVLQDFDFYGNTPVVLERIERATDRPVKEIFYIPALLLLGLVIFLQRRRQTTPAF